VVCICFVPFAAAQKNADAGPKWEVEVHAGVTAANHPTAGVGALPPPGNPFITIEGTPSRSVQSWFFGDGALLLNQVQALDPSSPYRITPLDSTLTSALLRRDLSGVVGVRLNRRLNARLSAEVSAEFCACRLSLEPEVRSAVEASRASFDSTWKSFFSDWKSDSPVDKAGAIATISFDENKHGGEIFITGTLNIALRTQGKLIPYLAVGAGTEYRSEGLPIVTLTGFYGIEKVSLPSPQSPSPNINFSDTLTMHFDASQSVVGVVGGGIKYNLDSRWGLRFDARMHLSRDSVDNLVDTGTKSGGTPRLPPPIPNTYVFGGDPSIQFSTTLGSGRTVGLKDFRTYRGNGIQQSVIVTAGVFRKF
jgi:hypothetical protein